MAKWSVYMHENRVNGKKYIGITSQKPEKRWKNGLGYENSPHFFSAIGKYGWDKFRQYILYTDLSKETAEELEIYLIAEYETTDPRHGYNEALGGNTTKGYKISEEGRKNISDAHLGNEHTKETREKMSLSRMGIKNSFFGKHHTEDARVKNAIAHNGHPVLCVETGRIYPTLGDAERDTGVNRYQISGCCHKKASCKTAGGFHWQFS